MSQLSSDASIRSNVPLVEIANGNERANPPTPKISFADEAGNAHITVQIDHFKSVDTPDDGDMAIAKHKHDGDNNHNHVQNGDNNHMLRAASETKVEDRLSHGVHSSTYQAMHLQWLNLNYGVVSKQKDGTETYKQILYDISGEVKPGEMVAIMGSSGAGKTTLLNVLAGRVEGGRLEGRVLLNGAKRTKQFRRQAAYVEQTDLLFSNLTVRETLAFTAKLRLPGSLSDKQKTEQVESVINELGLEKCAETFIGGIFLRGVSGGEKRRVSIGVEMITHPNLIFLDEPTSGLDSTTAYRVISSVKKLSTRGRSVLVTIHQPKSSIFNMFDKVILLAQGKLIFFGSPAQALIHFDRCGYKCPAYTNPADFYLDITTFDGDSEEGDRAVQKAIDGLSSSYTELRHKGDYGGLMSAEQQVQLDSAPKITADLNSNNSDVIHDNKDNKAVVPLNRQPSGRTIEEETVFPNTWVNELSILVSRNFLNFRREKMATTLALFQSLFISTLIGLVFLRLGNSQSDVQNRLGVLFFLAINQSFQPVFQTITVFTPERAIFRRERASGAYRVSSYFLAKNVSEFPLQVFFPFLISTIVYWMVGLRADPARFFTFCAIVVITSFTAQSLGLCIAAVAPNIQIAQIIAPLIIIVFMLFGGFFLNQGDVRPYFIWLKWISYINYSYRALTQNEFTDASIERCAPGATGQCYADGNEVLRQLDVTTPSVGACIGIMIAMALFFRALAYFVLLKRDKPVMKLE